MAKDKKMVAAITSMDEDFAQWYTDVVTKAELVGYTSVKMRIEQEMSMGASSMRIKSPIAVLLFFLKWDPVSNNIFSILTTPSFPGSREAFHVFRYYPIHNLRGCIRPRSPRPLRKGYGCLFWLT